MKLQFGPLLLLCLCVADHAKAEREVSTSTPDARSVVREAYIWGYPSVDIYNILYGQVLDPSSSQYLGTTNTVHSVRSVSTPGDTLVIAPNVDTPYSYAWLDLRNGPLVLVVPPFEPDRYVSMQLVDAYTWITGYVSPRTHGHKGARVLVAPPGWTGTVPSEVDSVLQPTTTLALAQYRVQLRSANDLPGVHAIQDGFRVESLEGRLATPLLLPAPVPPLNLRDAPYDPAFFSSLAWMMQFMPPLPEEFALRRSFAGIGLTPGQFIQANIEGQQAAAGMADGLKEILERSKRVRSSAELFGSREFLGNDYLTRASGALLGILGNSAEEYLGVGWNADANGDPFTGERRYTVRFGPGELPPVEAFWSITVYNGKRLLYANELNRYVINSAMLSSLRRDADGGLTLQIQNDRPDEGSANWLPVPEGRFGLTFRTYLPGNEVRTGEWKAPPVVPEDLH